MPLNKFLDVWPLDRPTAHRAYVARRPYRACLSTRACADWESGWIQTVYPAGPRIPSCACARSRGSCAFYQDIHINEQRDIPSAYPHPDRQVKHSRPLTSPVVRENPQHSTNEQSHYFNNKISFSAGLRLVMQYNRRYSHNCTSKQTSGSLPFASGVTVQSWQPATDRSNWFPGPAPIIELGYISTMTFWVAFIANVFGRFQRNFAHFTVVACAKFCWGRSSTAFNSGREIWPRPFTRKQTAKISTPDRQPWHRRLMFPQSVNEPVTSPRTVLATDRSNWFPGPAPIIELGYISTMTFWVAFVANVFGRFQRNFAHFTVVACAEFCCGRSSTASNSGREIWPRPFTRKQTEKNSTPDRQPWHRRLIRRCSHSPWMNPPCLQGLY